MGNGKKETRAIFRCVGFGSATNPELSSELVKAAQQVTEQLRQGFPFLPSFFLPP